MYIFVIWSASACASISVLLCCTLQEACAVWLWHAPARRAYTAVIDWHIMWVSPITPFMCTRDNEHEYFSRGKVHWRPRTQAMMAAQVRVIDRTASLSRVLYRSSIGQFLIDYIRSSQPQVTLAGVLSFPVTQAHTHTYTNLVGGQPPQKTPS